MKKKMKYMKDTPKWKEALKQIKIDPNKLNLKELKAFKDADQYLSGSVDGPKEWEYIFRCFRFLTAFALGTVYEKRFPPLTKCWEEISRLFIHEEIFNDGVFLESWVFCDFPFGPENETVLNYFEDFLENTDVADSFQYFIDKMKSSRFGLYQEILSNKKNIKLRELFTDKVIIIANSIHEFEKGEIFLTRLIEIGGKSFAFGDPKCWPKEYKSNIEDMIYNKMFHFKAPSIIEQYEQFMKYAGPYWMSCMVSNQDCPILEPDHYLEYLD
jgi:hypothetical protein